jgi:hypothetical protein
MKQKSPRSTQFDSDQNGRGHGNVDDIRSPLKGSPIIVGKTLRSLTPRKKSRITPPTTDVVVADDAMFALLLAGLHREVAGQFQLLMRGSVSASKRTTGARTWNLRWSGV